MSEQVFPEIAHLPSHLSNSELLGACGTNRADPDECLFQAEHDIEAVYRWLNQYRDNAHTLKNYKKEAERLLLWCVLQCKKPLSSLDMDDFDAYFSFIQDPKPREFWVGERSYRRDHPQWRPFVGVLSEQSVRNSLRVIKSMMSFLQDAGYVRRNPINLLKKQKDIVRETQLHARLERILEPHEWQALLDTIAMMPNETESERRKQIRLRFIFAFMFLTGVRTEEFANLKWSNIRKRDTHWWLYIKGKRNKEAVLPINDELLLEISKYRQSQGLESFPFIDEDTPILRDLNHTEGLSSKQLYKLIKQVGQATIDRLELVGKQAEKFKQFSGHWIRHYLKSHMSKIGIPYDYQRYIMRHAEQNVTDMYQHGFVGDIIIFVNKLGFGLH